MSPSFEVKLTFPAITFSSKCHFSQSSSKPLTHLLSVVLPRDNFGTVMLTEERMCTLRVCLAQKQKLYDSSVSWMWRDFYCVECEQMWSKARIQHLIALNNTSQYSGKKKCKGGRTEGGRKIIQPWFGSLWVRMAIAQCNKFNKYLFPFLQALAFKK